MNPDLKTVEQLIEIITREVLVAMAEQQERSANPEGQLCKFDCAEGLCVRTCFDRAGRVVSAGAERLSSTIGVIPQDTNLAQHDRPYPAQTGCHPRPDGPAVLRGAQTWLCLGVRQSRLGDAVRAAARRLAGQSLHGDRLPARRDGSEVKAFEAQNAIDHGATEIDMVINIGALKARDLELVAKDIRGVVIASHARGAIVKVIIETVLVDRRGEDHRLPDCPKKPGRISSKPPPALPAAAPPCTTWN